jgi:hypothetical protein
MLDLCARCALASARGERNRVAALKQPMATKSRPKQKQDAEATESSFPLAEETKTYEAHLAQWGGSVGQFVVIKGCDVLGFYPRHDEALEAAYDQIGQGPFLVKQISLPEPIYQLGHVELQCHTSP